MRIMNFGVLIVAIKIKLTILQTSNQVHHFILALSLQNAQLAHEIVRGGGREFIVL